jgi:hypothetical protein
VARIIAWVDEYVIFTFEMLGELEEKCLGLIKNRLGLTRILKLGLAMDEDFLAIGLGLPTKWVG